LIFFVSHYTNPFSLAINEVNYPQVESALPVTVAGKRCPCLYLSPQAFSSHFVTLSPVEGGEVWQRLGGQLVAGQG